MDIELCTISRGYSPEQFPEPCTVALPDDIAGDLIPLISAKNRYLNAFVSLTKNGIDYYQRWDATNSAALERDVAAMSEAMKCIALILEEPADAASIAQDPHSPSRS